MTWKMWLFEQLDFSEDWKIFYQTVWNKELAVTQEPVTEENLTRDECVWGGANSGRVTTLPPGSCRLAQAMSVCAATQETQHNGIK